MNLDDARTYKADEWGVAGNLSCRVKARRVPIPNVPILVHFLRDGLKFLTRHLGVVTGFLLKTVLRRSAVLCVGLVVRASEFEL
jgi:hypothetical protein